MNKKRLSALCSNINILSTKGSQDPITKGLAWDSRDVKPGFLFFALSGVHTDGHNYIGQALKNGASIIVHSKDLKDYDNSIKYIKVQDTRFSMAAIAAAYYDNPSEKLKVIGVTGTDGKSSTVSFINQLLEAQNLKSGFISTVEYKSSDKIISNPFRQSTPEAPVIQKILKEMLDNGLEYAVIEATSHGLSKINNRLGNIDFDCAVITNISQEHLEFHGSLEQYVSDKANLFRDLKGEAFSVLNINDEHFKYFKDNTSSHIFTYGLENNKADYNSENIKETEKGFVFDIINKSKTNKSEINIPGIFNINNALAGCIAVSKIAKIDFNKCLSTIKKLKAVKGRMTSINMGQNFKVIVDYAHTPGSFSNLLPSIKKSTKNKLIVVFGSAGERDIIKRKIQGELSDKYCDIIILTDEDPRQEDPLNIIKDIAAGCKNKKLEKNLFFIEDRKSAIQKAFSLAEKDDCVLLLGKGHESSIIYKDGPKKWNEIEVTKECLKDIL